MLMNGLKVRHSRRAARNIGLSWSALMQMRQLLGLYEMNADFVVCLFELLHRAEHRDSSTLILVK